MKSNNRTKALLLGATLLGTVLFSGATASAQNILQNLSQSTSGVGGGNGDWDSAIWGSGNLGPTSSHTYETPSGLYVRTDNNTATTVPPAFAGNSLQIDSGGTLYLKNSSSGTNPAAAVVNLVLAGGSILFHGANNTGTSTLGGTLVVSSNSLITTDQTGSNVRNIGLQSSISGSGNLTLNMLTTAFGLILSGNNSAYTGNWSDSVGFIEILSGTTNALGSGSVTLAGANELLILNSTNQLVINNPISGPGSVLTTNTNTVVLGGANTFTGSAVISGGTLQIGAGSSLTNASLISLTNKGTLDASLIGGLTLNAGQNMNCNGTVISNLTAATGNTLNFNLNPTTNDILNVTGSLTLNGAPNLNLAQSGYVPGGIYRLINYGGSIQGGGLFNLVPPTGSSETFALDTSTPGQVNLIVTGVTYNLTWAGDGSANDWDTSSPNWTGGSNVFAFGDNVTFNDSGSASPAIDVENGTVYPGSVTINNTANYYTFQGSGIAASGSLVKTGANEVDFANTGNAFSGPISIQGGILSIGNGGSTGSLGTGPITNNGVLQVNLSAGGVALNSPMSGSGSLNVTGGGAAVTIGATNSYTGGTTIGNGCQLNISTSSALGAATNITTVLANGRLGVASLVGSMTVPNPLVISGTGISGSPGALYVNTTGNNVTWAGPITLAGDAQFRVVNVGAHMNLSSMVLGTNVALECTSGNTAGDNSTFMTFQNTVSLGSGGSLTADGLAVVVLAGAANIWGGGTTLNNAGTLLVNGTLNGGPLEVNNPAALGGTGTILDPVTVDGTLAPGPLAGIGTLTISNSVTINSDGTALMEINRSNAQNATLLSATSITYGGTLTVNNIGSTSLQAGDTFNLFAGSISGTFAATNLPALPSTNLYWDTSLLNSGAIQVASAVALAPSITSPSVSGTNFTLQVPFSQPGFNYVVQATPTLAPAAWTGIQTNAGTDGTLIFTIPITPGNPQTFYRISVQQ
jgi:autotransporter-associated beta strand protein